MKAVTEFARKTTGKLMIAVALACGMAAAQAPPPPPGAPPGPGGNVFFYRGANVTAFAAGFNDKVVTGAPYSATVTTQTSQILGDGNQINRTSTGTVARDSQGRTRRDMTLDSIGPWVAAGKTPHFVLVNDVVAGNTYVLHPEDKTAQKLPHRMGPKKGTRSQPVTMGGSENSNVVTVALGTQTIGGVLAEGTRYTRTIAAGAIGNEKPIVVVTERWYSSDLQTEVMTKLNDPRIGWTVYAMSDIQRSEPDAALFQVPADFTITQGPSGRGVMIQRSGPPLEPPPGL